MEMALPEPQCYKDINTDSKVVETSDIFKIMVFCLQKLLLNRLCMARVTQEVRSYFGLQLHIMSISLVNILSDVQGQFLRLTNFLSY